MSAKYIFDLKGIFDLIAVILVLTALFVFFARKKSIKLLLIYTSAFIVYITVCFLDIFFHLPMTMGLANLLIIFMLVVLIIVYQSDFKAMFFNFSKTTDKSVASSDKLTDEELRIAVDEIVRACQTMSKARTGALIVIATTNISSHILETGTELGALLTAPLLECIFNTQAPFHDGAIIVKNNKVLAAGCFLPLSQSQTIAKSLGTRHRAGIGITEETDMLTIIVSEETGIISIAKSGELRRFITPERLRDILRETYKIQQLPKKAKL